MWQPESADAAGFGGKVGNAAAKGDVGFILLNSEDTTPPSIRVGDAHVAEGNSGVVELVFMTMPPEGAESLFYRLRPVPLW